jgi:hypothetical protein
MNAPGGDYCKTLFGIKSIGRELKIATNHSTIRNAIIKARVPTRPTDRNGIAKKQLAGKSAMAF